MVSWLRGLVVGDWEPGDWNRGAGEGGALMPLISYIFSEKLFTSNMLTVVPT